MAKPLTTDQITSVLADLSGWTFDDNKLRKSFEFGTFREAVSFIVRLAFEAERMNHHPELINVYNRVEIALTTHDAGDRVTEKDLLLARAIESIYWR
jgi:4a-hydroxytetrahydrobiopterin dehydratase